MLIRLLLAAGLLLGALSVPAAARPLTVVADEWPPFSGESLPNGGISLDVIATVLERAGYEVETRILPWARVVDGARKGEYDIVGSLFYDAEMAEYLTYGEPFFQTQVKFVQRKGAGLDVSTLDTLRPYSIAVGDGFLYEERFDRTEDLNKILVTTALQGIQMVAYGRVDLTLDSEEVIRYSIQAGAPEVRDLVELLPDALTTHAIHMAVFSGLPDSDKVVADFNRVLGEMRADGSLSALLDRHRTQ